MANTRPSSGNGQIATVDIKKDLAARLHSADRRE
jgi:hypothetical protein